MLTNAFVTLRRRRRDQLRAVCQVVVWAAWVACSKERSLETISINDLESLKKLVPFSSSHFRSYSKSFYYLLLACFLNPPLTTMMMIIMINAIRFPPLSF